MNPQERSANKVHQEQLGDRPGLGYGLPRNLVPVGRLPPRATDARYIELLQHRGVGSLPPWSGRGDFLPLGDHPEWGARSVGVRRGPGPGSCSCRSHRCESVGVGQPPRFATRSPLLDPGPRV